jgi:glycosyltransferase involved in cell wall biosynthesis
LASHTHVRFLNLRGDMRPDVPASAKVLRLARYYARLLHYAASSPARVFHLLWNNKFEHLDRTIVLAFYRLLGKRLVMTVHNVNIRQRDGNDSWLNRLTLRCQYRLVDHLFVHTQRMAGELMAEFAVPADKVSVIPFGINNTVPDTALDPAQARERLGLAADEKVLLFFGNIARYKGLDRLVEAMPALLQGHPRARLVIAGRPKGEQAYWDAIERRITELGIGARVLQRIEYVPDEHTEVFFKAADVLVLPYTQVFQSGVLFLGYNFGLPVVATNVGSLREEIVDGQTGHICDSSDPADLARTLDRFFRSAMFADLTARRTAIRRFAADRFSWATVASISKAVYGRVGADSPAQAKRKLA